MTGEYEKFLEEKIGNEAEIQKKGDGVYVKHQEAEDSFRAITGEGNITASTAYLIESKLSADTDYGFADLHQAKNKLENRGYLKDGESLIDISSDWENLLEEGNMHEGRTEYGENYDERATEIARVIDGLDKRILSSKEISEYLELTPSQVSKTMKGIAKEEEVKGDLAERTGSVISWNVHILGFNTNLDVELNKTQN
jgi:hypothetical protein